MTCENRHHQNRILGIHSPVPVQHVDQLAVVALLIWNVIIKNITYHSIFSSHYIHSQLSLHHIHTYRGSSFVLPRPYRGMTLSLLIAALHTGHNWRVGRVSNHWCKHGQQNRWPHKLTTASLAVSKQILHSNTDSSFLSPESLFFESLSKFGICVSVLVLLLLLLLLLAVVSFDVVALVVSLSDDSISIDGADGSGNSWLIGVAVAAECPLDVDGADAILTTVFK